MAQDETTGKTEKRQPKTKEQKLTDAIAAIRLAASAYFVAGDRTRADYLSEQADAIEQRMKGDDAGAADQGPDR